MSDKRGVERSMSPLYIMRQPCPSTTLPISQVSIHPCSPLQGRADKLRCYKTGRSSESVAAFSVRTGLT